MVPSSSIPLQTSHHSGLRRVHRSRTISYCLLSPILVAVYLDPQVGLTFSTVWATSWEIQKVPLGNSPEVASRAQVQTQGQLPKVTSTQPVNLVERFLLTPKPLGFCVRTFDLNSAVTSVRCACTHIDLGEKKCSTWFAFPNMFCLFCSRSEEKLVCPKAYFFLSNVSDALVENTTSSYRPVLLYFISLSHHNFNHAIKCSSMHFLK